MSVRGILRATARAAWFLGIVLAAWSEYWLRIRRLPSGQRRRAQAEWLHRGSVRICRLLKVATEVRGTPPPSGLIASNHLSYLDVFVLSAAVPCIFVAKQEITGWPVFGRCARYGGTIFIDRTRRGAVAPVLAEMREVLAAGLPLVLFPEGTTSHGETVLPFNSALFGAAFESEAPVTANAIGYELPGGSAKTEICYAGVALLPHLWNLLSKPRLLARLSFSEPRPPTGSRKTLAIEVHSTVSSLHRES